MRVFVTLVGAVVLAACSANPTDQTSQSTVTDMAAESAAPPGGAAKSDAPDAVTVSVPQLAYAFALSYLVPADRIADTQDAHRTQCERMGPARCQLLAMERGTGEDRSNGATMKLRVASSEASAFSVLLDRTVSDAGGRPTDAKVEGEDVSKAIVDTKARIAQRELLVARLTKMLRERKGSISELIEAERSVAAGQEELDQAKAWLSELRGRVAMSTFDIRYAAIAPSANAESVGTQLADATQASAATFLMGLRTVFTLLIYLLPWALLAFPLIAGARWLRRKAAQAPTQL
ncbi:MAG: DUF4349 domain-containing protein [Sphingomonadales bacterium]|nr:MAG: DUF4349 domain-containing protein [Sphingomonadales bacterium]